MLASAAAMTAWVLRLMPRYVGRQPQVHAWWFISSISWLVVFLFAIGGRPHSVAVEAAFGIAAPALGALGAIDIAVHRLPRQISYVALVLIATLLITGSASRSTDSADLLVGTILMFIVIGTLRIVSRGSLGNGDLHLAPLLGALIGWFDPSRVLTACVVMSFSAAIFVGALMIGHRRIGSDHIAYGPFMLLGTAVAIIGTRG